MPNSPKKINRKYRPSFQDHKGRSRDNSGFYNSYKWRKFRKGFLNRNPLCTLYCQDEGIVSAATVVDHKEQSGPGAQGWDLNDLKDEYYNAACKACHDKRSGRQRHGIDY
jgi:5-methylcytosine-specific restriction protein A